ncbi:ABSCISIC ACID-INSENSITIVE 5-like protein 6 isoform X2 [Beta vulgaris subsp. vulgaris]|uniref:ABSCISIC ACID-INSENSITIVE 5-like protein 6 isoform X2 n=1 Tax=Beta vulgaris subsp. vulgaris TaxID=3555 RepID=UPI002037230E|nr:ABSCISIC ACID-INSENSITIVE 5-like protein 6 isoform X2 [Beta vulgaris subsp. vulgaris]
MGTLGIGVTGVTELSEVQTQQCRVENYWYKLNVVHTHLGILDERTGSMNIDEFIKNDWTADINQSTGVEGSNNGCSAKSLQSQGSLHLSRTVSEKMVDEVWREIQQGGKITSSQGVKREPSIGEMTLEDFLAKAGAMDECSLDPVMPLDIAATSECFSQQMGLSPVPSITTLCDKPNSGRRRDFTGTVDRGTEKRLKRKIKNRESAARSRARKQAYHNELVSKVSQLEEQNIRLKKEKLVSMSHVESQSGAADLAIIFLKFQLELELLKVKKALASA